MTLAAAFSAIVTGQWKLQPQYRISCAVVIGVSALIVAILFERSRRDEKPEKPEKPGLTVLTALTVVVASGTIGWLIKMRAPDAPPSASTTQNSALNSTAESQKKVNTPASVSDPVLEARAHSPKSSEPNGKSNLLKYIKAPIRSASVGNAWPVLMFGVDGSEYPVLRARAELVLQNSGSSTPHIFANYIDPDEYKDLFNTDVLTISTLRAYCDGVVLGRIKSATSASDQFDGLYTTHLAADVKIVSTAIHPQREFTVEENGAGTSAVESRSKAEERLAEKLKVELSRSLQR